MARKIAELFSLNHGIQPFYTACCFRELSRGSVLCLLNAFETAISQHHNSIFYAKIDDLHPLGQNRANTRPMVPSGGIYGSPRPVVLGNALSIVPPDLHGRLNDQQRRCIVLPSSIVCRA
jgi:hypothetical protein